MRRLRASAAWWGHLPIATHTHTTTRFPQNSTQQLENLEKAFDSVKRQLLDSLHNKLR